MTSMMKGFNCSGELVAYRGLFLIDKNGVVQHQTVNNMPLEEMLMKC